MRKILRKFLREQRGVTVIEYAVAGGLIGAAALVAFFDLGNIIVAILEALAAALT